MDPLLFFSQQQNYQVSFLFFLTEDRYKFITTIFHCLSHSLIIIIYYFF